MDSVFLNVYVFSIFCNFYFNKRLTNCQIFATNLRFKRLPYLTTLSILLILKKYYTL